IAEQYWVVRSASPDDQAAEALTLRGAVLIAVKGTTRNQPHSFALQESSVTALSPELSAALSESTPRPLRALWRALIDDGILAPAIAAAAMSLAVVGVVFEAVLLRSALDVGTLLHAPEQRLAAGALLVAFATILLGVKYVLASAERRMGAHLEARLRTMFL